MKANIEYSLRLALIAIVCLSLTRCEKFVQHFEPEYELEEGFDGPAPVDNLALGELLFHSGFEGTTVLQDDTTPQKLKIIGIDNTVSAPNNWESLSPYIGNFKFEFEGGDETMRKADIIPEPSNPSNKVLRYWLADANAANYTKARIQSNAYNGSGIKEMYQSVRMYLSSDFNTLKTWNDSIGWLTIFEFWNNKTWGSPMPYPFRISVNIVKPSKAPNTGLYFSVAAQKYENTFVPQWDSVNMNHEAPIGKWITMEYYFKEGDASDGRFYLAMTPEGGSKVVLVDVNNLTRHPDKVNSVGLQNFNPMKLYTSKKLMNFMKSTGKVLEIYWDDFALWKDRKPDVAGSLAAPPKVVLKLDDITAFNGECKALSVMEYLINRKVKASYGVIANTLDTTAKSVLHDILIARDDIGRPMAEFWHHGLLHKRWSSGSGFVYEFQGLPYHVQKEYFEKADSLVKKHLGVQMVSFGAPYNQTDSISMRIIHEHPSYRYVFFSHVDVPYPLSFTRLNDNVPMENGTGNPQLEYFKNSFNVRSGPTRSDQVIILQGHPNLWNEENFEEFKKIIDYLEHMGCEFIIPKILS